MHLEVALLDRAAHRRLEVLDDVVGIAPQEQRLDPDTVAQPVVATDAVGRRAVGIAGPTTWMGRRLSTMPSCGAGVDGTHRLDRQAVRQEEVVDGPGGRDRVGVARSVLGRRSPAATSTTAR